MQHLSSPSSRNACQTAARRSGFTLVELLVVIGIIALLISILLPSLNRARQQANAIKCSSNMRSIGQAMQLYAADFKGTIVPAGVALGTSVIQSWDTSLKPYMSTRIKGKDDTTPGYEYRDIPFMQCPTDTVIRTYTTQQYNKRSYAMVSAQPRYSQDGLTYPPILGTGMVTDVSASVPVGSLPGAYAGFHYLKFSQVRQSSETLLLAEYFDAGNNLGRATYNTYGPGYCAISWPRQQIASTGGKPLHQNKWNYLMCDGSVQRLHPTETLKGKAAQDGVWNDAANAQWYLATKTGFSNYMWTIRTDD